MMSVALRKESVDRNYIIKITEIAPRVALRKESVDRNRHIGGKCIHIKVALRKESVDRNTALLKSVKSMSPSLSARRAWIEMLRCTHQPECRVSLSARRAWIEI